MLIRHLDFFVTLAEERHFGRTAELCGVSQPALSLAIRKLEEDLGAPLILRGRRYEGLTAEGEKVLLWGRQILAQYGNLRADLGGRRKGGLTGTLRLGVSASAMPLVPAFCEVFETQNPLARIHIEGLSADAIEAGLEDFTLDGGFGWLPAGRGRSGPLIRVPLWPQNLKFACGPDHPFAADDAITLRDALTQPLCLAGDLPVKLPQAIRPLHCSDLAGVLAHLRTGRWCSIVPAGFARLCTAGDEIRLIGLADTGPEPVIGACLVRRAPQSPLVQAFDDALATLARA